MRGGGGGIPFDMPPFTGAEAPLAETLMNV
jgi:hypothetical protein